jgi:hypothetical protein
MGRFELQGVFVAVVGLLGLFSGCLSFVVSFFGIGMLCGVWLSFVGLVWNLYSACLPPGHFWIADLVCGVGVNCIVHIWWGHGFVVVGGSHSWHVHPSIKMSWFIGVGWGRQWAWIHRRHRSHCSRLGSLESPSPRWHWKHGGSSSAGIIGLSVANWGVMLMCVMGVPLVRCACAIWYGQVMVSHSTR